MTERPRVFVTHAFPGFEDERGRGVLAELERRAECRVWSRPSRPSEEELRAGLRDCEGLLCLLTDRIDSALLRDCPRLRVISSCSVGLDHIDLAAAFARDIVVGHTPGVLTQTTADLAFGLLLAASRRLVEADRCLRAGVWTRERRWEPDFLLGRDLHAATLGIVGMGAIGQAVACRARGFGMRVLAWSRTRRRLEGVEWVSLEELLARSDFVSLHVALVAETRGLIDAAAIARMKAGAVLVNTARGGLVDEQALAHALREGHLAAAGLDVFESEPIAPESPLRALDNVVLTPHIGSASVATRTRMARLSVANLLAGLEGRPLPHRALP